MDARKRTWIWGGLALPAGIGLVRAGRVRAPVVAQRILLVGDGFAKGLAVPLRQLAEDAGYGFRAEARPGTTVVDWASHPWLQAHVASFEPTLVLVSLSGGRVAPPIEARAMTDWIYRLLASRARPVWIAPPAASPSPLLPAFRAELGRAGIGTFPTESLALPPPARGFAGGRARQYATRHDDNEAERKRVAGLGEERRRIISEHARDIGGIHLDGWLQSDRRDRGDRGRSPRERLQLHPRQGDRSRRRPDSWRRNRGAARAAARRADAHLCGDLIR